MLFNYIIYKISSVLIRFLLIYNKKVIGVLIRLNDKKQKL